MVHGQALLHHVRVHEGQITPLVPGLEVELVPHAASKRIRQEGHLQAVASSFCTDMQTDRQTDGRTDGRMDRQHGKHAVAAQADTQTDKLACRQTACCISKHARRENEHSFPLTSLHVVLGVCACLATQTDA